MLSRLRQIFRHRQVKREGILKGWREWSRNFFFFSVGNGCNTFFKNLFDEALDFGCSLECILVSPGGAIRVDCSASSLWRPGRWMFLSDPKVEGVGTPALYWPWWACLQGSSGWRKCYVWFTLCFFWAKEWTWETGWHFDQSWDYGILFESSSPSLGELKRNCTRIWLASWRSRFLDMYSASHPWRNFWSWLAPMEGMRLGQLMWLGWVGFWDGLYLPGCFGGCFFGAWCLLGFGFGFLFVFNWPPPTSFPWPHEEFWPPSERVFRCLLIQRHAFVDPIAFGLVH